MKERDEKEITSLLAMLRKRPGPEVDPAEPDGLYDVLRGKYGKRKYDKPLWWILAYHLIAAFVSILPILAYVAAVSVARYFGVELPGSGMLWQGP